MVTTGHQDNKGTLTKAIINKRQGFKTSLMEDRIAMNIQIKGCHSDDHINKDNTDQAIKDTIVIPKAITTVATETG